MGGNQKSQEKAAEKSVASDQTSAPSKVGTEAIHLPGYQELGKKEYASFGPLNIEMEQNGILPKFSVNLDQQKMADMIPPEAQDTLKNVAGGAAEAGNLISTKLREGQETAINAGESLNRGFNEVVDSVGKILQHDYGKDVQKRLAELASELDAGLGALIHGNAGEKPQPNMPHPELGVIQDLKDRPMNSFNCHYLVKSHIEGTPPNESKANARNEQVTPNYLKEHGYQEVDGKQAKPGDIVVVEDTGPDGKGHYYNHAAIVSGVDGKGHVTETLQKLNPDAPVATLDANQFKGVYAPSNRYKIHIYRNPSKEGHLE